MDSLQGGCSHNRESVWVIGDTDAHVGNPRPATQVGSRVNAHKPGRRRARWEAPARRMAKSPDFSAGIPPKNALTGWGAPLYSAAFS